MQPRQLLLAIAVPLMASCGIFIPVPMNHHLYPISGPYSQQHPTPVFDAGGWVSLAELGMTVQFPDRESIHVSLANQVVGSAAANDDMAPVWDKVFGPGYYNARILGALDHMRGTGRSSLGTQLDVETSGEVGVARDSRGNIFKIAP